MLGPCTENLLRELRAEGQRPLADRIMGAIEHDAHMAHRCSGDCLWCHSDREDQTFDGTIHQKLRL